MFVAYLHVYNMSTMQAREPACQKYKRFSSSVFDERSPVVGQSAGAGNGHGTMEVQAFMPRTASSPGACCPETPKKPPDILGLLAPQSSVVRPDLIPETYPQAPHILLALQMEEGRKDLKGGMQGSWQKLTVS
jgi:hypothetical protein